MIRVYVTNMSISLSFPTQFQPIDAIIGRKLDCVYGIYADEKSLNKR